MTHPPQDPYAPRPGSRAWIEQYHGRVADFTDRILPGLADAGLTAVVTMIPAIIGAVLIAAGVPRTQSCGVYATRTCDVPGTGSVALIVLGVLAFVLAFAAGFGFVVWNRIWRVHRTGRSLGKTFAHLRVVDTVSGAHPDLGPAVLRELVHQLAGVISWIWIFVDADDRTLADIVASTHVVHDPPPGS